MGPYCKKSSESKIGWKRSGVILKNRTKKKKCTTSSGKISKAENKVVTGRGQKEKTREVRELAESTTKKKRFGKRQKGHSS